MRAAQLAVAGERRQDAATLKRAAWLVARGRAHDRPYLAVQVDMTSLESRAQIIAATDLRFGAIQ